MKKRLMCLGLCLMMLAPATLLSSCSSGNVVGEDSTVVPPMTVTLKMITDGRTTKEGILAVQNAINEITENELSLRVVLQLYTKDEYKSAVLAANAARAADYGAGNLYSSIGKADDQEKLEVAPGMFRYVTAYPEVYDNQMDILMVTDQAMLNELADQGALADMTEAINSSDAALSTKYMAPGLMAYGSIDGSQYAIPGNAYYGDYEYLLVKKDLFDKYPYSISEVNGLASLRDYLVDVAENEKDVTPLYNIGSLGLTSLTGRKSVVSSIVANGAQENATHRPDSILRSNDIQAQVATIIACGSVNGDYAQDVDVVDFEKNFAAAFVSGDASVPSKYEKDYYVIKTRNPIADADEIFRSMFAVSAYSSDTTRCMKLVNMIMTNEKLLNTLLYGVENVTYTLDSSSGIVSRKYTSDSNEIYIMDENLVGNTFLAWQNDEMTETELAVSANKWKLAKQASTDVTYSPFAHFTLKTDMKLEKTKEKLDELYTELWTRVYQYGNGVDSSTGEPYTPDTYVSVYLSNWLTSCPEVLQSIDTTSAESLAGQYLAWYHDNFAEA